MQTRSVLYAAAMAIVSAVYAQSSSSSPTTASSNAPAATNSPVRTITPSSVAPPTGSYNFYTGQASGNTVLSSSQSGSSGNATGSVRSSSTTNSLLLMGSNTPIPTSINSMNTTTNSTASRTSSSAAPTNTQPCNGYVEFCDRKYMNVTEVCAHNSAFVRANNAASNQAIEIVGQLNDGVRMIQGETHYVNNTIYSCHTSCDLLNAGTLQDELTTVAEWVQAHPYDVLTILLVNSDFVDVNNYTAPIMNAGLGPYLFVPPKVPMHRDDWPTYQEIILSGKRVVVFMDYNANQTQVPYILDEFSQMWETPYSPTDINFPCTQQRPPGLNSVQQGLVPYLANHNLNVQISFGSLDILIPNFAQIDLVNANNDSTGSLMSMAESCTAMWDRPPAWLLVDFYNVGAGSVFEVAARMNNVTYNRTCCGQSLSISAANGLVKPPTALALVGLVSLVLTLQ